MRLGMVQVMEYNLFIGQIASSTRFVSSSATQVLCASACVGLSHGPSILPYCFFHVTQFFRGHPQIVGGHLDKRVIRDRRPVRSDRGFYFTRLLRVPRLQ